MRVATREMDIIKKQVNSLSKQEMAELIEYLTKSIRKGGGSGAPLQFGKYKNSGKQMSTPDDFKIAEWHEADLDLNGN